MGGLFEGGNETPGSLKVVIVCSLHFREEEYSNNGKFRRLKPSTVPTIFPHKPRYKVTDIKRLRRTITKTDLPPPKKRKSFSNIGFSLFEQDVPSGSASFNDISFLPVENDHKVAQEDPANIEEQKRNINRLHVKITRLNKVLKEKQETKKRRDPEERRARRTEAHAEKEKGFLEKDIIKDFSTFTDNPRHRDRKTGPLSSQIGDDVRNNCKLLTLTPSS
ncbi:hypothetical protein ANN_03263 [Periplaneta americana]|uniref:THAP-type domain-containing protein n=1 Tax=Periplaneta americana TaxID=6978 RepID=A0ABQ8U065_PERAM|nr:hypothetical protein ANN_03263 [Periplaneta americana]